MIVSRNPEICVFAHPKAFLDFSERWRLGRLGCDSTAVVERHLHKIFSKGHHRNPDASARNLEILGEKTSGEPSAIHLTHAEVEGV